MTGNHGSYHGASPKATQTSPSVISVAEPDEADIAAARTPLDGFGSEQDVFGAGDNEVDDQLRERDAQWQRDEIEKDLSRRHQEYYYRIGRKEVEASPCQFIDSSSQNK